MARTDNAASLVQLLGFSDVVTAAIGVCTSIGAAIGFLVGGGAGDYFSIRFPNAARPAINQISLVFAAPLYIAFLKGLPGKTSRNINLSLDDVLSRYVIVILMPVI